MNQGFDSPYQSSLSLVGAGMQYSAFGVLSVGELAELV